MTTTQKLTQQQTNIIIGSTLGDASITKSRNKQKTACFRFSHSLKQQQYCNYKAYFFDNMSNHSPKINTYFYKCLNKDYTRIDFTTKFTTNLYDYYSLFYKNNKKTITQQIDSFINPEVLSIWYMDDGSIEKRITRRSNRTDYISNRINLHTNSFSLDEQLILQQILKNKFNLDFKIKKVDYGKHFILCTKSRKVIEDFVYIISPYIISSMKYKIQTNYLKPMKKKYTKLQILKIGKKLNLNERKQVLSFRKGKQLYGSIVWYFKNMKKFQEAIGVL